MVVIGNPPYNGESKNKSEWITELIERYKQEPGGGRLREQNYKWLNNDYVKFVRLGEHLIERNGFGILGFITSNSYLDSPIFRGMRYSLLHTFDKIVILDLHGSAKRDNDQNVFDITEGVSIFLGIKSSNRSSLLASVYYLDLSGSREHKYDTLFGLAYSDPNFKQITPEKPQYYLIPKNFDSAEWYNDFFSIPEAFH